MFQWSLGILPSFRSPRWQPFLVVFFLPILVVVSIGLMNLVTAAAWNKVLNLCFGTGLKDCWRFCKNGLEPSFHSRRTHVINCYYTLLHIYIYIIYISRWLNQHNLGFYKTLSSLNQPHMSDIRYVIYLVRCWEVLFLTGTVRRSRAS